MTDNQQTFNADSLGVAIRMEGVSKQFPRYACGRRQQVAELTDLYPKVIR